MAELITQKEYAKRRGGSPQAVSKAVKEGRILLINRRIDPEVADVQWASNSQPRANSGGPGSSLGTALFGGASSGDLKPDASSETSDYWQSRARREQAEADLAQMKAEEARGTLINRAGVDRAIAIGIRALRDAVRSVPERLPIPREQQIAAAAALREAFEEATQQLARISAEPERHGA
ncbi:MAG: hypothetical protein ACRDAM_05165 [Casimicrobium sp.]